jgi:hypothetical protein
MSSPIRTAPGATISAPVAITIPTPAQRPPARRCGGEDVGDRPNQKWKANVKTNLLPDGSIRISALETIEAMEHLQWIAEEAIGAAQLSGRYLLPIPTVVVTILS